VSTNQNDKKAEDKKTEDKYRIVGVSAYIKFLEGKIKETAKNKDTVLILGPRGSGKENIARNIHLQSERRLGPFIPANCAGIPEQLFESLFFGIGPDVASTVAESIGIIGHAKGGTVFLDEIGDLSLFHQAKFLRFLNDKSYARVGEENNVVTDPDVKIIAATNKDLEDLIEKREFRADLYDRISSQVIRTQSLSKHIGDLICLINHYANKEGLKLDPRVKFLLYFYDFPGNVRELQILIKKDLDEIIEIFKKRAENIKRNKLENIFVALERVDILEKIEQRVEIFESRTKENIRDIHRGKKALKKIKNNFKKLKIYTLENIGKSIEDIENLMDEALEVLEEDLTNISNDNRIDKKADHYYKQFGELSNYGFSHEDYNALNILKRERNTVEVENILKEYGDDDLLELHRELLRNYFAAIDRRDKDILDRRLRFFEVAILKQDYGCSKTKICELLHIADRSLSTEQFKKEYHFDYPERIKYEIKTPLDVLPEPEIDDGWDE
jgi:DNA-binding NtrC family response regulator